MSCRTRASSRCPLGRGSSGGRFPLRWPTWPRPSWPPRVSPAAEDIGRTYPVSLGLVGDPRATLEALLPLLSGVDETEAGELTRAAGAQAGEQLRHLRERARAARPGEDGRMHPLPAVEALLAAL